MNHTSVLSFGAAWADRNAGGLGLKRSWVETPFIGNCIWGDTDQTPKSRSVRRGHLEAKRGHWLTRGSKAQGG